jgi:hypothetical protein
VSALVTPSAVCKGEKAVITASGAITYTWSDGTTGSSLSVTGATVTTLIYTLTGVDALGCSSTGAAQLRVNACTGISELSPDLQLNVYPNPNNGNFTISFNSDLELTIMSELGQLVKTVVLDKANNYSASMAGLAKGIYFITGQKNNATVNRKVIIE